MGQKTSPIGFRLGLKKSWRSSWFANKREFAALVAEDVMVRKFLLSKPACVGASQFLIRRMSGKLEVVIHSARPGLVIGKKGAEIDLLKQELKRLTKKDVWIEVEEVKRPDLDAKLVAEGIAKQLERRMPFRHVLKRAARASMDAGAAGVKIQVSGRIGGAEIARTEWNQDGTVPLHTLDANISYARARAKTSYGAIGVKVWINLGE